MIKWMLCIVQSFWLHGALQRLSSFTLKGVCAYIDRLAFALVIEENYKAQRKNPSVWHLFRPSVCIED